MPGTEQRTEYSILWYIIIIIWDLATKPTHYLSIVYTASAYSVRVWSSQGCMRFGVHPHWTFMWVV